MRTSVITTIILSVFIISTHAQKTYRILPLNADCTTPVELSAEDTIFGPTNAPEGFGKIMEITGEVKSIYYFRKEHNTVWYKFTSPYDCTLSFDIIPIDKTNDYDFILFKLTGNNYCKNLLNKTLKPVRACISRNDPTINSQTGLHKDAKNEFVHSGPGPSYCKPVSVKKGDVFMLILDNVYPNGSGHTLRLFYNECDIHKQVEVTEHDTTRTYVAKDKSSLSVTIIDKETRQLIKSSAYLFAENNPDTLIFDSITSFFTGIEKSTLYTLQIEANNYFDYSKDIKTLSQIENLNITIELDKITIGKNIIFEDILFYGNEARFLPESKSSLKILLGTMVRNPNLKIEIQGHVNCPSIWDYCETEKMQEFNMTLSIERAKAVYIYLEENGIAPERMTYQGYGHTRMIYPDARSEDKMKKNRRVEVVIISN